MTPECSHEKYLPIGLTDDWNLMNWDKDIPNKNLKVNMCKKCNLLYWEILDENHMS